MESTTELTAPPLDGRRVRGARSRRAVLDQAIQEASIDGLDGLTFGRLAVSTPVTKSGIAGLFGSKEGLQLATVERAREVFIEAVVEPARAAGERGLPRLWALTTAWLGYSRDRVFAGGCLFLRAADTVPPGPVRDAVAAALATWSGYLAHQVRIAVERGELDPDADPEQVVFELRAFLELANNLSVLTGATDVYRRAEKAARVMLEAHGASGL